jgi:Zn-dependent protease with chaperone function
MLRWAAIVLALWAASATAAHAQADSLSARGPREARIVDDLRAIAPGAVPLFERATLAMDRNELTDASDLFTQVLAQAPAFSPAQRRLGYALAAQGRPAEGVATLRALVARDRSPENVFTLASVLAYPQQGVIGTEPNREEALALARDAAARNRHQDDPTYDGLVARIALSLGQYHHFREAVDVLAARFPNQPETHYFAAIRAAIDDDWRRAEQEIRKAESLGLPREVVEAFLESGVRSHRRFWRFVRYGAWLFAAWLVGLVLLFAAGKALSGATLRSIERTDPNETASAAELTLRHRYRALVRIAGVYYYLSQPFVLVLVVGFAGAVVYAFLAIGRVPIQLFLIVVLGALVTVYKMVQTLFVKRAIEDPGRPLGPGEAPGLWRLTREVAERLGTRPIDEIRVTPGTEMAVYERGDARERSSDRARRVLILGVGLLSGFREGAFRAVLAHEYGHFAHRDTAGGEIAMRVGRDMSTLAIGMAHHGQAVWWNLAFQFLRVFNVLFRRVTHGATRLQEVLADRVAASLYGAGNFEEGLRHVVQRSIEFEMTTNAEIRAAIESARPLQNLYTLSAELTPELKQSVEEAIGRPTTEDDTHPGPLDRFRLVHGIVARAAHSGSATAWEWFSDREALTTEMTATLESQVRLFVSAAAAATAT